MKKVVTVVAELLTLLSVFYTVLAQEFCGPIGSSDAESGVARNRDAMFYLNTANPSPCSGIITSWRVCYYGPDSVGFSTYLATYAIYRRMITSSDGSERYEKISSTFRAVRATGLLAAVNSTGIIDGSIEQGGFNCYDDFIDAGSSPLIVQAGDLLGACVFDPIDSANYDRRQLDVVGETEMDGESLLEMSSSGCTTDALPSNIPISQLSMVSSRRLHIYANIVTTEAEQSTEAFPTPPVGASPIASTTAHTRPTTNPSTMATLHSTTPLDIQESTDQSIEYDSLSTQLSEFIPSNITTNSSVAESGRPGLTLEAIVGIVVGSLLSLLLGVFLAVLVFCLMRCRRTCYRASDNKMRGFENMVYGTGQEEGKQNGESTCIGLECGAREMPVKDHVYELTSGCIYDVPKKLTYSTQGPSDEMLANSEHYYSPVYEGSTVSYAQLLERNKQVDIYGNIDEYLQPPTGEIELYAQLKACGIRNIPSDLIQVKGHLGSGQFGSVQQGVWKNGSEIIPVALKVLKEEASETDKVKFLQEAAIMAQFTHPNVVSLYGVVSKGEPLMLVAELVQKGDLRNFLLKLRPDPGELPAANLSRLLLSFCQQVALGMHYLSSKRFIHRDLAARNILISNDNICKVADFGMSRDLADENYYVSQGGKVPVKWTAPEAIHYMKYSTASDVWSYGCLLYEIWSLGHKPFEKVGNDEAIDLVDSGKRLSPPPGCSRVIYELMIKCWNPEASQRPLFRELLLTLLNLPKAILSIPQEALDTHSLAGVLGSTLKAGKNMHKDLQDRYIMVEDDHDYQEVH